MMLIPEEHMFLVRPISFSGPNDEWNFPQLDGTIVAPTNAGAWGRGLLQWLQFTKLVGISIQGKGTIEGSGSVWWQDEPFEDPQLICNQTATVFYVVCI
uniref:Uncharacterized protein n=1 Tax=Rhizophora mucronata TaxID=61149 RepID=A0A2P2K1Q7_RHIMU